MRFCIHRWSNVKRWSTRDGIYHIIQRCRRCNTFVRKDVNLKGDTLDDKIETVKLQDRSERIIVPVEEEEIVKLPNCSAPQSGLSGNGGLLIGESGESVKGGLENPSSNNEIPNAQEPPQAPK